MRHRPIGVLGSVEHAYLLRQWSDDVVFFPHSSPVTADERRALVARQIAVVDGLVGLSVVDDRLHAVRLADGRLVRRAALFMRPTLRARDGGLLASLGCELDDAGFARVDATGRTSVPVVLATIAVPIVICGPMPHLHRVRVRLLTRCVGPGTTPGPAMRISRRADRGSRRRGSPRGRC